jgi:glycosyltransferase involved in cell wall biosynthesis
MNAIIHFCEGELALRNFIFPICKSSASPSIIFVSRITPNISTPARVFVLPTYVRLGLKQPSDYAYLLPTLIFLALVLIRLRPCAVVSHMSLSSPIVLFAAFISRIERRIYFNHGFSFLGYHGVIRYLLLTIEYLNFLLATKVISVSPSQRELAISIKYLPRRNVTSTNPGSCAGLPLSSFISDITLAAKVTRVQDKTIPISVAYIGRPVKRKGFPLILEIIQSIDSLYDARSGCNNPVFNFFLIGVSLKDALKYLSAEQLNSIKRSNVQFIEHTNVVQSYLFRSSIMLLPSLHEGFGYAFLEAAAQGNCLMGYDIPGPDSLLCNMVNSYTFPLSADSLEFASSLLYLNRKRDVLASLMRQAREVSFRFEQSIVLNSVHRAL